jgi:hypothetical protein
MICSGDVPIADREDAIARARGFGAAATGFP